MTYLSNDSDLFEYDPEEDISSPDLEEIKDHSNKQKSTVDARSTELSEQLYTLIIYDEHGKPIGSIWRIILIFNLSLDIC
jgi:hypothetical protein